jgi:Mrp family chromosome partitioning ATPase
VEAELFKVLRTNLFFPPKGGNPPKSIMVTSAIPGDGKSLVSANLAISIAQGIEEHVLLIDADIRKPSMNTYFGIGQAEGTQRVSGDRNGCLQEIREDAYREIDHFAGRQAACKSNGVIDESKNEVLDKRSIPQI